MCSNWPWPLTTWLFSCQHGGCDCLFAPGETALHEVRRYDAEDPETLDMKETLKWWKVREQQYKYMSQFVIRTLCITASSVPSERLFSLAGNLVNQGLTGVEFQWTQRQVHLWSCCERFATLSWPWKSNTGSARFTACCPNRDRDYIRLWEMDGTAFPDCTWAGWSKHGNTWSTSAQLVTKRLELWSHEKSCCFGCSTV